MHFNLPQSPLLFRERFTDLGPYGLPYNQPKFERGKESGDLHAERSALVRCLPQIFPKFMSKKCEFFLLKRTNNSISPSAAIALITM